jgi:Holliday junction resolvase
MTENRASTLSAFANALLADLYRSIDDPGAFGRIAQTIIGSGLRAKGDWVHENPGAGVPDLNGHDGTTSWAWEIKHITDHPISLSDRDIEGLQSQAASVSHAPRLVVLDMRFPARLWVLDGATLNQGETWPEFHAELQQSEEANELALKVEALLRYCDVDLVGPEADAKALVLEAEHIHDSPKFSD